jgi:putative restriction endonuclease
MRERLLRIRARFHMETDPRQDFSIGCVLVNQPVFFEEGDWVRMPEDWSSNIVQGKGYELTSGEGKRVWMECVARASRYGTPLTRPQPGAAATLSRGERGDSDRVAWERGDIDRIADAPLPGGYGEPTAITPRLGQRSFRIAVLDTYARRCTVTNERTLPALEAAHIRDYRDVHQHEITNGILFRADIHKLFDAGYVTVTPDYNFEVSRRIKEEFENGRDYYKLHGSAIRLPAAAKLAPAAEGLRWHNEERYRG